MMLDHADVSSLTSLCEAVAASPEHAESFYRMVAGSATRRGNQWLSQKLLDYIPSIKGMDNAGRIDATHDYAQKLRSV